MSVIKTIGVEYCEQCPFSKERKSGQAFCCHNNDLKTIPKNDWRDGNIPEWCPLPNQD